MEKPSKKKGFTLIEMNVGIVVLLILFLMTAGIELFLLQNTVHLLRTADQDPEIASVLNHMDRHLSQAIFWRRSQRDNFIQILFFVPDAANPNDRTRDIQMWYTIDLDQGMVRFASPEVIDVDGMILIQGLSDAFVSAQDANSREVYVDLQNSRSALQYRQNGTTLGRTMRLRGVW